MNINKYKISNQNPLGCYLSRENNNIDLIKLCCAILIIWNHSYDLSPLDGMNNFAICPWLPVPIFGFFSGLVVTNSIIKNKSLIRFFIRSFLRLYVPFFLVVVCAPFLMVPFFIEKISWGGVVAYIYNNLCLSPIFNIEGILEGGRNNYGINGSLWCMPIFIGLYLYTAAMFSLGLLNKSIPSKVGGVVILLIFVIAYSYYPQYLPTSLQADIAFNLCFAYLMGMLTCLFKDDLVVDAKFVFGLFLILVLLKGVIFSFYLKLIFALFFALLISISELSKRIKIRTNITLGLFLYSFPVQQIVSYYFSEHGPLFNFSLSVLVTSVISYSSAVFLEKKLYELADTFVDYIKYKSNTGFLFVRKERDK